MTRDLTDPENRTNRTQGWQLVDRVKDSGGCACCTRRDRTVLAWGRSVCGLTPALTFPKCVGAKPAGFEADPAVIYSKDRVE